MSHSGEEQTAVGESSNGSNGSDAPEVIGVRRGMFGAAGSGDLLPVLATDHHHRVGARGGGAAVLRRSCGCTHQL